jgi:hypothetical protein
VGALLVGVIVTGWTRWILSPDFRPTSTGSDRFTGWQPIAAQSIQYLLFLSALGVVWRRLIRPVIRERRLSFDGMLVISGCLAWFYEPMGAMFNVALVYNAHLPNMGSWAQFIPFWHTPHVRSLVTPPLFDFGAYVWFVAGFAFLAGSALDRIRARFPEVTVPALLAGLFVSCALLDVGFETLIVRSELYAYPASAPAVTLWGGGPYQLPLVSVFGVAALLTGLTAFRSFGRWGRSFPDRGADEPSGRAKASPFVGTLAVIGFTHLWMLATWFVPFNIAAQAAGSAPRLPSYMRDGVCGPGTGRACPTGLRCQPESCMRAEHADSCHCTVCSHILCIEERMLCLTLHCTLAHGRHLRPDFARGGAER